MPRRLEKRIWRDCLGKVLGYLRLGHDSSGRVSLLRFGAIRLGDFVNLLREKISKRLRLRTQ